MDHQDVDGLLERGLSGDSPREAFRARVLLDSTAAFARRRQSAAKWRLATLSAAAVLMAAVSFLLGRYSMPRAGADMAPVAMSVGDGGGMTAVPIDLVAWMEAARFFRRLGMADRMARAYERASALLPREATAGYVGAERMFVAAADGPEQGDSDRKPELPRPTTGGNRIMAQMWGD